MDLKEIVKDHLDLITLKQSKDFEYQIMDWKDNFRMELLFIFQVRLLYTFYQ